MKTVVVGAGPVGLVSALGLAAQGREVTVIDRDPGPAADGSWSRRGVMQFEHPHAFRPIVGEVLHEIAPRAMPALIAAGCVPVRPPGAPHHVAGLMSRRSTFERRCESWPFVPPASPCGRATSRTSSSPAVGCAACGSTAQRSRLTSRSSPRAVQPAGRAGRAAGRGRSLRPVLCHPDLRQPGPGQEPIGGEHPTAAYYDGYTAIVFPHDAGTHSVLLVRASDDDELALSRSTAVFDSLAWRIPVLADAVDPRRFTPLGDRRPAAG